MLRIFLAGKIAMPYLSLTAIPTTLLLSLITVYSKLIGIFITATSDAFPAAYRNDN